MRGVYDVRLVDARHLVFCRRAEGVRLDHAPVAIDRILKILRPKDVFSDLQADGHIISETLRPEVFALFKGHDLAGDRKDDVRPALKLRRERHEDVSGGEVWIRENVTRDVVRCKPLLNVHYDASGGVIDSGRHRRLVIAPGVRHFRLVLPRRLRVGQVVVYNDVAAVTGECIAVEGVELAASVVFEEARAIGDEYDVRE